jgi:hypothetical protein
MFTSIVLSAALLLTPTASADIETKSAALSGAAQDMKGYEQSLYTGKWYNPKYESTRKCIMRRESHFNYRAANRSSSARGAYQFLDSQWRVSLTHMLMPEHKHMKKEVKALRKKPIHKWNRYWQDAAFWTVWRHGQGKKHWYYGGSLGC